MAEKKIISADTLSKTKTKKNSGSKLDFSKIKDLIDDNPEAVEKIKDGVVSILGSNLLGKKTTKKSSTKKTTGKKTTTTKKSDDGLSKVMDIAGSFLKRK